MTKFKHGDRVTCTITRNGDVHNITDAKISIDNDGTLYICHNNLNCSDVPADDLLGYQYGSQLNDNFPDDGITNLKLSDTGNAEGKTKDEMREEALKEYNAIVNPAWEEYIRVTAPADKQYSVIKQPALIAYNAELDRIHALPDDDVITVKGKRYKLIT